jgi:ankyrin repeat protein
MMTRKFRNKPSSNSIKHIRKSKKSLKNKRTNKIIGGADQLVEAIQRNNTEEAITLLNKKTSIIAGITNRIFTSQFDEPLKLAIIKGYHEIVKLLIEKGANINVKYDLDNRPLHIAIMNDKLDIFKLLIEKRADINAKNINNVTPLHIASSKGKFEIVKLLIENRADINAKNINYDTPLHNAIMNDKFEIVKLLIENRADINAKNINYDTPLHNAIMNDKLDIVKLLIEKGADINIENTNLIKPLHSVNDEKILNLINTELINDEKYKVICNNILLYYINRNNPVVVKILIEKGINVNIKDKDGNTPLHIALKNKDTLNYVAMKEIVGLLIQKGADINAIDKDGNTPLHVVIQTNRINPNIRKEIVDLLIKKDANINIQNVKGKTPLYIASNTNEVHIGELLIGRGADVNMADNKGVRPLHIASRPAMAKLLIDNKAILDAGDEEGKTPLHWYAKHWYREHVKYDYKYENVYNIFNILKEFINKLDKEGNTPLDIAIYESNRLTASALKKNRAVRNKKDNLKTTLYNMINRRGS